jgi:hypothetical protein
MRMNDLIANGPHIYRIIIDRFQGNSAARHAHFETGAKKWRLPETFPPQAAYRQ